MLPATSPAPSNPPTAPVAASVTPPIAPAAPLTAAAKGPIFPPGQPEFTPAAEPPPSAPLPFDFPLAALPIEQQAELRRRLARLPGPLAQAVLDEYNSALGRRIRFRNRWGWFEYLIRAALDGRFIPTSDLAERRAAQAQRQAEPAQAGAPPIVAATSASRRASTVW